MQLAVGLRNHEMDANGGNDGDQDNGVDDVDDDDHE